MFPFFFSLKPVTIHPQCYQLKWVLPWCWRWLYLDREHCSQSPTYWKLWLIKAWVLAHFLSGSPGRYFLVMRHMKREHWTLRKGDLFGVIFRGANLMYGKSRAPDSSELPTPKGLTFLSEKSYFVSLQSALIQTWTTKKMRWMHFRHSKV